MLPWKWIRSVLKLGTRMKFAVLIGVVATPFLILSLARGSNNDYSANLRGRGLLTSRHIGTKPVIEASQNENVIAERFAERRSHLREQCGVQDKYFQMQNSENAVKEHLTIDKKHKLVYCAIEKIGCTFWKRVFQILSGFKNVSNPFEIQGIRAYEGYITAKGMPFDKIYMILKASSKFMFVREPYERLLSGYVDKLFAPNAAYWAFIGSPIVTAHRSNATDLSKKCGHDVTFEEFVRYFVNSQESNVKRDAHFVPEFEHCRPCEIDYDYIGKLETFEEDTLFLLKKLKMDDVVKFKNFEKETETDAIVDAADYVFSMKNAISKCMPMTEALLRAYRKLQIRGYISNEIPFPFDRASTQTITIDEFKQALLRAHAHSGSAASRKANRKDAFHEAYSSLPQDLLDKLMNVLSIDANLFGYEVYPKSFENLYTFVPPFNYFKV